METLIAHQQAPMKQLLTQTLTSMTAQQASNQMVTEEGAPQRPPQTMQPALQVRMRGPNFTPAIIVRRVSSAQQLKQLLFHALQATTVKKERLSATFVRQDMHAQLRMRAKKLSVQQAFGRLLAV